jgi:hypothetical protein
MSFYTRMMLMSICLFGWGTSFAELLDNTLVNDGGNVNAPLGVINKSLQQQIGAGHGDVNTFGSAVFLTKRDPARSVRRGRQLFQRKFSMAEGVGPRVNFESTGDVTVNRALGAGLADSCALCHGRPRGSAGFGGDVATRPDSRDAPHLFGLGLPEMLADEMTADLRAIRTAAITQASGSSGPTTITLQESVLGFCGVDGNVETEHAGFTGAGFANTNNQANTTVRWSVNVPSNGSYTLVWRYAFQSGANRLSNLLVNGATRATGISFPATGSFSTWATTAQVTVNLTSGRNLITLVGTTSNGTANIDFMQVTGNRPVADNCTGSSVPNPGGGNPVTMALVAKGVSFGSITANPNGTVNTSQVVGVNPDLRVRPFFHQGGTISMREFINGAFNDEMGLQSVDTVLCAVTNPANPQRVVSPAGFVFDPALDTFERPSACGNSTDPDGDGITNEIDTALVDHMEFYFLNYFKPGQFEVTQRATEGLGIMNTIGCTSCHVQNLTINRDRRVADVETVYDPARGIFNDLFATASTLFHPVADGNPFPQLLPNEGSFVVRNFFSDLKRHDLGAFFHEREYNGTLVTQFVTEPLWGVGTTAPYGHDGRSINLNEVILRHGGEATTARNNYAARSEDDRRKVQEFLQTLVLFGPDDTASNLNPGNPNTTNPQPPTEHGSIDLSQLFQIPAEGPE